MGNVPDHFPSQGRQTPRMWWAIGSVFILLVIAVSWILFYDGPPPDDGKMLPQWTPQEPGKPNPLEVFISGIDNAPLSELFKLPKSVRDRAPGSETALRAHLPRQEGNCNTFDKLMSTDIHTWQWPGAEKLPDARSAFPDFGWLGSVAQMLRCKIHLLKIDGKIEEAVALSLELSRFGAGVQSAEGMLYQSFCGQEWQRHGQEALREVLFEASASPELLRKSLRQMQAIPSSSRDDLQFAYKVEYLKFKNMTRTMTPGQILDTWNRGRGATATKNRLANFFYKRNRTLSTCLELEWPFVEALERSWMEAYATASGARKFSAYHTLTKGRISPYLDPNFGGTSLLFTLGDASVIIERAMIADALKRQTELMLALRLFELEKGRLPAKLEDLMPDYMTAIPEDAFTGKPMHWDTAHETVYSIGGNGVDDGGTIDAKRPHKGADVGMRYWWSQLPAPPAAPKKP